MTSPSVAPRRSTPSPPLERGSKRLARPAVALLFGALALREALSFWTGHPYDLEVWIRTGRAVASGTSPYLMPWPAVPGVSIAYPTTLLPSAAYLPFWPAVFGGEYRLWECLGGGNRFVLYFIIKQGPIAGDLACGALIYRLIRRSTGSERSAFVGLLVWSLFPYDILISAVWGQVDSVTTAAVLGLLCLQDSRSGPRTLVIGLGIFAKWVTAIFLPLELFRNRGWRRFWPLASVGLAAVGTVVCYLAFHWSTSGLIATGTSQSHGGGSGMNLAYVLGLPVVVQELAAVPWVYSGLEDVWIPAVILAGWLASRWLLTARTDSELRALVFIIVAFCLTRWGLYEQYMLYLFAPLIVDVLAFHPGRRTFLVFLAGLSLADLLVNNNLGIWFGTPAWPGLWVAMSTVDTSSTLGVARTYGLAALAVLVTVTLLQLLWVLWRDDPAPVPWLYGRWVRGLRRASQLPNG